MHQCEISEKTQCIVEKGEDSGKFARSLPNWKLEKGNFIKYQTLGSGSYGTVFLLCNSAATASQESRSNWPKYLAMKSEMLQGAKEVNMAENEIRNMRAINHPNCMSLFGAYAEDYGNFLRVVLLLPVMTTTLLHLARCGSVQVHAANLIWQALQGLHHCHERLVLHRDLKPSNMLLQFLDEGGHPNKI